MVKIAVELEQALRRRAEAGRPGDLSTRVLAQGEGWRVADVLCTSGPKDQAFEEQHSEICIAMVVAGSFQYRSTAGCELMTPGSLVLGNAGQYFECRHEHGAGDRCLAFFYTPEDFGNLIAQVGGNPAFSTFRVPPLRALAPVVARACASVGGIAHDSWEELSLEVAAQMLRLMGDARFDRAEPSPSAVARVTRVVRMIDSRVDAGLTLEKLAREAGLSRYHFVRIFRQLTGVTPHQYILRARLREAAIRVMAEPERILDIAFDCGFGDVSNFNHAFRAEFGVSQRMYRNGKLSAADFRS